MPFSQKVLEQSPPGGVQMPQLGLQHTSVTLQVLIPQGVLTGDDGAPQKTLVQAPPGGVQTPQLGLQHTWSDGQLTGPQGTRGPGGFWSPMTTPASNGATSDCGALASLAA